MNPVAALSEKLLNQPFDEDQNESVLEDYKGFAQKYAKLENSMAVLSDLKLNKSYIFHGGIAEKLGIAEKGSTKEISSIWEEEIFSRIHPDDLVEKHLLELQFFQFVRGLPANVRSDYQISSNLRMRDALGMYQMVRHRMVYVCSNPSGQIWLALCLYNVTSGTFLSDDLHGVIVNSSTGALIMADKLDCRSLLTKREIEILRLIENGLMSKNIAECLSISKKTVDRHRQNILEKLRVRNSFEACRVAKRMNLI